MRLVLKVLAVLGASVMLPAAAVTLPVAPTMTDSGRIVGPFKFSQRGGAVLYRAICQGCHMADGTGATGAGSFPALANNLKLAAAGYPIFRVLYGRGAMPPFKDQLDDQQVCDIVTYIRMSFGNSYPDKVTAEQVTMMR